MDHSRLHITVFNGPLEVTHRSFFNGSQERLPIAVFLSAVHVRVAARSHHTIIIYLKYRRFNAILLGSALVCCGSQKETCYEAWVPEGEARLIHDKRTFLIGAVFL